MKGMHDQTERKGKSNVYLSSPGTRGGPSASSSRTASTLPPPASASAGLSTSASLSNTTGRCPPSSGSLATTKYNSWLSPRAHLWSHAHHKLTDHGLQVLRQLVRRRRPLNRNLKYQDTLAIHGYGYAKGIEASMVIKSHLCRGKSNCRSNVRHRHHSKCTVNGHHLNLSPQLR